MVALRVVLIVPKMPPPPLLELLPENVLLVTVAVLIQRSADQHAEHRICVVPAQRHTVSCRVNGGCPGRNGDLRHDDRSAACERHSAATHQCRFQSARARAEGGAIRDGASRAPYPDITRNKTGSVIAANVLRGFKPAIGPLPTALLAALANFLP